MVSGHSSSSGASMKSMISPKMERCTGPSVSRGFCCTVATGDSCGEPCKGLGWVSCVAIRSPSIAASDCVVKPGWAGCGLLMGPALDQAVSLGRSRQYPSPRTVAMRTSPPSSFLRSRCM